MIFSVLDRPEAPATNPGDPIVKKYKRVDPGYDMPWYLEEVGEENIQKLIDSSIPPSISEIVNHAMRGDLTLLNDRADRIFYGDVSAMSDLGTVMMMRDHAEEELAKLNARLQAMKEPEKEKEVISDATSE